MVTPLLIAALLTGEAVAAGVTPVTVEIVASGHVETPADRFRVSGNVLACATTQPDADALLARKVAAIEASMRGLGVTKAQPLERPSLSGMMGAMMATRGTRDCNSVDLSNLLAKPDAATTKEKTAERSASAPVSFDAPSRSVAVRVIAALTAADAKPSDKPIAMLVDDTAARRAAKQQALTKARAEAAAYAASLGTGPATLSKISEKQDWNSTDFAGQMVRLIGLAGSTPGDTVATDITLTVEFRLGDR
ncbi:SIMPL domain-containing protein [Sphingomonas sp. RB3P16]|uniref:SIMPL domain-containing protein n=1 Tax=Parasphingomonas frigoris TaxID=3096163 RepID=UPI002FC5FE87